MLLRLIRYLLSNLILFDNYRIIYLVNNKVLLEPGLFSKLNRRIIKAGTSSIPIINYGT
jgi:hypothetical protein